MTASRRFLTRLTAAAVASIYTVTAHSMSMTDLFNSVNADSNISSPAVVQGQTMNMYTGGSMFVRMPKRSYNITTFTPPSWNAGCGGIDIFAGGFSFINKEQFVALLRNIGSNALGYGFKLAIQNLCPTCDNVMQALQATAQAINRQNIDSCEAAKGVVNAALPDTWTRDKQNSAKNFGVDTSLFSDITDAWTSVMNDESRANETLGSVREHKPEVKDSLPVGNVVWNALKKVDGISDEYRMLLMSMIGTSIFPAEGPMRIVARKEITLKELIGGNVVDGDGLPMGQIDLPIWRCVDMDECLTVTEDTLHTDSFKAMVRTKMNAITDKIAGREPYEDAAGIMKFLNATDLPVYKMLAVTTTLGNTTMADTMVNRYQELIAAKYAEVYIQRAVTDLRLAISKYSAQASPSMSLELDKLRPQLEVLQNDARQTLQTAYSQTVSTYAIAQEVGHMERALNANLSQTLRSALAYGKSLR